MFNNSVGHFKNKCLAKMKALKNRNKTAEVNNVNSEH